MTSFTIPSLIEAHRRSSAAEWFTYRQAILELQRTAVFSTTFVVDAEVPEVSFSGIPSELAVLRVTCVIAAVGEDTRARVGLGFRVNDIDDPVYSWGLTEWMPPEAYGGGLPATYSQKHTAQTSGYGGLVTSDLGGGEPCSSEMIFPNWGVGDRPLLNHGTAGNYEIQTHFAGRVEVERPFTSLSFTTAGNVKVGSVITLTGFYS